MTPRKIATNHKENILALRDTIHRLGLQVDPQIRFGLEQCMSPFPATADKFFHILTRKVKNEEFKRAMHGNEMVPVLAPELSVTIGYTESGKPYRILLSDLVMHVLVCGATGSGKTTQIALIVNALVAHSIRLVFLDAKDEGNRFIAKFKDSAYLPFDRQRWNILQGVLDQKAYIRFLAAALSRLMSLMPVTASAMQAKLLAVCHNPDDLPAVSELSRIFEQLAKKEMRSSLATAARGFGDLYEIMGRWAGVRSGDWPFDNHMLSVVPIKDIPPALEVFLVSLICKRMTDLASLTGHSAALRQMIVFDEGRNFFGKEREPVAGSGKPNLPVSIMTTMRSFGLGIVIGSQSASKIQSTVLDNCATFIAMRCNSEQEGKACCRRLGLDESRYMELVNMEVGHAWVVSPQCRQPVKIKVPFTNLGDYPRTADIEKRMAPVWTAWDAKTVFAPHVTNKDTTLDFRELLGEEVEASTSTSSDNDTPKPSPDQPVVPASDVPPNMLGEYFTLIESIKANPNFGTTEHYKSLGWSASKGTRVKNKLIDLGWIETARAASPKGGRPREIFKTTINQGEQNHEQRT